MWNIRVAIIGVAALVSLVSCQQGYNYEPPKNAYLPPGGSPGYQYEVPEHNLESDANSGDPAFKSLPVQEVQEDSEILSQQIQPALPPSSEEQTSEVRLVQPPAEDHDHDHGHGHGHGDHEHHEHWDLRESIPGEPGTDYPLHYSVPDTGFSCTGRTPGYYADVASGCQAFHVCQGDDAAVQSFLCPNGSIFHQEVFACDWWNNVDCAASEASYIRNNEIGVVLPSADHRKPVARRPDLEPDVQFQPQSSNDVEDSRAYLPPVTDTRKPAQAEYNGPPPFLIQVTDAPVRTTQRPFVTQRTQPPTQRTQPPRTQPPRTQPPRTQPPRTEPPRTQPPRTQPPRTQPPRTQPPRTEPPRTQPPRTQPPRTQPPRTEPPRTQPTVPRTQAPTTSRPVADRSYLPPVASQEFNRPVTQQRLPERTTQRPIQQTQRTTQQYTTRAQQNTYVPPAPTRNVVQQNYNRPVQNTPPPPPRVQERFTQSFTTPRPVTVQQQRVTPKPATYLPPGVISQVNYQQQQPQIPVRQQTTQRPQTQRVTQTTRAPYVSSTSYVPARQETIRTTTARPYQPPSTVQTVRQQQYTQPPVVTSRPVVSTFQPVRINQQVASNNNGNFNGYDYPKPSVNLETPVSTTFFQAQTTRATPRPTERTTQSRVTATTPRPAVVQRVTVPTQKPQPVKSISTTLRPASQYLIPTRNEPTKKPVLINQQPSFTANEGYNYPKPAVGLPEPNNRPFVNQRVTQQVTQRVTQQSTQQRFTQAVTQRFTTPASVRQTYAPVTQRPVVQTYAPVTQRPVVQPVQTYLPVTQRPVVQTYAPVTQRQVVQTYAPVTQRPVVQTYAPVTQRPVVQTYAPVTQRQVVQTYAPVTQRPVVQTYAPVTQRQVVQTYAPVTQRPVIQTYAPVTQRPVVQTYAPVTQRPVVQTYETQLFTRQQSTSAPLTPSFNKNEGYSYPKPAVGLELPSSNQINSIKSQSTARPSVAINQQSYVSSGIQQVSTTRQPSTVQQAYQQVTKAETSHSSESGYNYPKPSVGLPEPPRHATNINQVSTFAQSNVGHHDQSVSVQNYQSVAVHNKKESNEGYQYDIKVKENVQQQSNIGYNYDSFIPKVTDSKPAPFSVKSAQTASYSPARVTSAPVQQQQVYQSPQPTPHVACEHSKDPLDELRTPVALSQPTPFAVKTALSQEYLPPIAVQEHTNVQTNEPAQEGYDYPKPSIPFITPNNPRVSAFASSEQQSFPSAGQEVDEGRHLSQEHQQSFIHSYNAAASSHQLQGGLKTQQSYHHHSSDQGSQSFARESASASSGHLQVNLQHDFEIVPSISFSYQLQNEPLDSSRQLEGRTGSSEHGPECNKTTSVMPGY